MLNLILPNVSNNKFWYLIERKVYTYSHFITLMFYYILYQVDLESGSWCSICNDDGFCSINWPSFCIKDVPFYYILCREPMPDLFYSFVFAHFVQRDERNNLKYEASRSSKFHRYHWTYILAFYLNRFCQNFGVFVSRCDLTMHIFKLN